MYQKFGLYTQLLSSHPPMSASPLPAVDFSSQIVWCALRVEDNDSSANSSLTLALKGADAPGKDEDRSGPFESRQWHFP